jgi:hypothetical protein
MMSHGSAIFSGQRQMYKFGRNKLDHSEKKYGLPLWLCTIENKDLIILVFAFQFDDMGYTCKCINRKRSLVCQTIDYLQMSRI